MLGEEMLIFAEGLFNGQRLRACSNNARLHWPHLFLASNGYGRLELDYVQIVSRVYASFRPAPTETELEGYLAEYSETKLLFIYAAEGSMWGQWYIPNKATLPRYLTARDRKSPTPPKDECERWLRIRPTDVIESTRSFANLHKISENLCTGVGVGVGVGIGEKPIVETETGFDLSNRESPNGGSKAVSYKREIERVWDYYMGQFEKNPIIYTLTPARLKLAATRFREALQKSGGDTEKAIILMKCAVDALRASEFHNGKNDAKIKYTDWELLWRSAEKFEKWLGKAPQ